MVLNCIVLYCIVFPGAQSQDDLPRILLQVWLSQCRLAPSPHHQGGDRDELQCQEVGLLQGARQGGAVEVLQPEKDIRDGWDVQGLHIILPQSSKGKHFE